MGQSHGVEGPSPKPHVGEVHAGMHGPESGGGVMQTPVKTLGDLEGVLIEHFGEKEGKKFYNMFLTTTGMMMLAQVQHAAQRAKKASQDMRMDTH